MTMRIKNWKIESIGDSYVQDWFTPFPYIEWRKKEWKSYEIAAGLFSKYWRFIIYKERNHV